MSKFKQENREPEGLIFYRRDLSLPVLLTPLPSLATELTITDGPSTIRETGTPECVRTVVGRTRL